MSNIKRSDVKNHMRPPFLAKIHLDPPESQPDATGFSAPEPEATETQPSAFSCDFVVEHSSPGSMQEPPGLPASSIHLEASAASKSARA
jgi:hypothetical protein